MSETPQKRHRFEVFPGGRGIPKVNHDPDYETALMEAVERAYERSVKDFDLFQEIEQEVGIRYEYEEWNARRIANGLTDKDEARCDG